eukprot:CAMPEP_0195645248 /NCGR_PEP_ID=MMETSP0815-20121206/28837_1 /TAXON_ID=97485 /ORGANISM="Prymnesium parvum, Strain Texoma1" /LENGTH=121 /DNA_ID=CAMNT_0040788483 /DNA_START=407 /DNA_END=773 /DNA_ORIENTATION=-
MELDRPFGATPTPTSLLSPTLALALEALEAFEADETLLDAPRMCSLPPSTRCFDEAERQRLQRFGCWRVLSRDHGHRGPSPTGHYVDGTELDDKGHASMLFVAIQGQLSGQHKTTPWNSPT